ncbi:hypothetical protein DY000_02016478 [Brassica cretica]|uniref:SMP domain-containing protein n=1 Tax=Brassica cretica TaxID=69181 RepID=A0ABQ7D4I3_BRACR|nr:hypothetical protein DY000_02016478 [Brassica cretica]
MVSQIVWLGVKDVFTQIAKDVVCQGLDNERSEVNERANPAQKPLAGELNRHAGQLAGELNHHAGQLAGELNRDEFSNSKITKR